MRIEGGVSDFNNKPSSQPQSRMEATKETKVVQEMKTEASPLKNQKTQIEELVQAQADYKADEHEIIQAIERANKHFKTYDRRLEFSIHDATKQIMVKVIDTDTDTVIREIPSEKILDMVAHLWEMAGILVDEKR